MTTPDTQIDAGSTFSERRRRVASDEHEITPTPLYQSVVRLRSGDPKAHINAAVEHIISLLDTPQIQAVLPECQPRRQSDNYTFLPESHEGRPTVKELLSECKEGWQRDDTKNPRAPEDILQRLQSMASTHLKPKAQAATDPFRELMNLSRLALGRIQSRGQAL